MSADQLAPCTDAPRSDHRSWGQVNIEFPDYSCAAATVHTHLGPVLADAGEWWFIRKHPRWRIRYRIERERPATVERTMHTALDLLARDHIITAWYSVIYEPETLAFGGDPALTAAHRLFSADSPTVLHLLATPATPDRSGAVELSLLALARLLRAAGLDWFEQADVWHRVTEMRQHPGADTHPHAPSTGAAIRRLLTLDTATDHLAPLHPYDSWFAAYDHAGAALLDLARTGRLRRGLRAVLAHHVLFHWNRLSLDLRRQHALAALARDVLLPPERNHHGGDRG